MEKTNFKIGLKENKKRVFILFLCIVVISFIIRLYAWHHTCIINHDGVLYIHQARAIYYGIYDAIHSCSLPYLSIYPICIVPAFILSGNWIIASRGVSLFFGTLTLLPFFLLMRRFFDDEISLLTTSVFSLVPLLVLRSVDVVRGPIYWFFLVLGLFCYISQIDNKKYFFYLFISCLSFSIATWGRIEAVLFIIVSYLHIVFMAQEYRTKRFIIFSFPLLILFSFIIFIKLVLNEDLNHDFRISEAIHKFSIGFDGYKSIRSHILELEGRNTIDAMPFFLHKARNLVWLIALGTLLNHIIKAFFYPFFLIFISGMGQMRSKIKDRRIQYLLLLSISALILLYIHILQTWIMENRFLVLFIFPAFIFLAFGLQRIIHFIQSQFKLRTFTSIIIVFFLALAFVLPKALKPRELDKIVFKNIGEIIAQREGNSHEIPVASSRHSGPWVSFYANLNYKGAPCPSTHCNIINLAGNNYRDFINNLNRDSVSYFLWEEKHWPNEKFNFLKNVIKNDLLEVGRWNHQDTSQLILYKVLKKKLAGNQEI